MEGKHRFSGWLLIFSKVKDIILCLCYSYSVKSKIGLDTVEERGGNCRRKIIQQVSGNGV